MAKYLLSFIAAVVSLCYADYAVGQEKLNVPDNEKIRVVTNDASTEYYYPALMLRYESGDTTLTLTDYHYLYYGYAFQDKYQPLEPITWTDKIYAVFERRDTLNVDDAVEIISLAKRVMEQDPFSPSNINYLTYAYGILGDTANEKVNADRFDKILRTIESSGTGMAEKSPWHVLWFSHAMDLITTKGYVITRRTIISRSVEYAHVDSNEQKIKGFYVDYSRLYWKRPESTPEVNSGRGFLINGIKVKK